MATLKHILRPLIGFILLLAGMVLFILPIPIGWLVIGLSAIFLAPYVPFMHRLMTWLESKDPTKNKILKRLRRKMDRWFPMRSESR